MTSRRQRRPWLPCFALVGLVACGGSSSQDPTTPGTGGARTSSSGGAPMSGGTSATGGAGPGAGTGGAPATGGASVETGGRGGAAPAGNAMPPAGGGAAATGGMTAPSEIPAGYPPATVANYAKCTKVPMVGAFCPGGGAGPVCMQCLLGGTTFGTSETTPTAEGTMLAGNYLVTLKLGGAAAGRTFVSAESSRGLLSPAITAAGQSLDYAFVVNVRAMEGQPRHAGGPSGYPGLNLFFSGPTATPPQVSAIGYALATPATKPVMVYMAGDSTVCDQSGNEFGGWGQMLPQFFAPPVGVANYANSGASSNFGFWNDIKAHWAAGDWVIIQFGHNDKGTPDSTVQANLERMVSDALAANVTPILVSPPARVQFSGSMIGDQSGLHAAAAKAAAAAKNVGYIDLTALSTAWYNTLGSSAAALMFHAHGSDVTHTNLAGADKLAALVVAEMKAQNIGLAKYLR